MSSLTPYRLSRLEYARRELRYALNRLDSAHDQGAANEGVALLHVSVCAERLASLAARYDEYLCRHRGGAA